MRLHDSQNIPNKRLKRRLKNTPLSLALGHKENTVILPMHEVFYIEMLAYHVKAVIEQINKVNVLLENIIEEGSGSFHEKAEALVNSLQDIIIHTASISRYFWPVRKESLAVERGKKLREVFLIGKESPLYDRGVRNTIEHFDERLDKFLSEIPTGTIYPSYVGSRAKIATENIHCFRAYFVDDEVFKILNNEIHMPPLLNEIDRIRKLLEQQINDGLKFE